MFFLKEDNFLSIFKNTEFGEEDLVHCEACGGKGAASSVSLPLRPEHLQVIHGVSALTAATVSRRRAGWCSRRTF